MGDVIDLQGRVAVVTGAGQGIGRAIALELARHGADVVIAEKNGDTAEEAAQAVRALGRRAEVAVTDVTRADDVEAAAELAVARLGGLAVWVNNAGITRDATILKMSEADFDLVLAVHMRGTFLGMRAAARRMRERGGGAIVNLSSISGKVGNFGQVNYAGAKAGIVGMTKTAAREFARYGIRVNAVQPGWIDTAMTAQVPEEVRREALAAIPLGRAGQPEEVARAVVFLASDYASYITGAVLEVTGGRNM
ncbi:MAG: 3-oxoacyl-ACP reductase FabG [Clostridia bacterium]|nr:3-oxoacyl-ACP reductase FabG [Clostridia bacterium]